MHSLRDAFYLVAIAMMLAMVATSSCAADQRQPTERKKPQAVTCVAPDGWTASIEKTPGGWACVMRDSKRKTVRAYFY